MTDHTPSPATDGLREAIEALAASWSHEAEAGRVGNGHALLVRTYDGHARELRAVLAAHPAPPSETATECEDGVFGSQDIADALGGRGPRSAPPVSSDEARDDEPIATLVEGIEALVEQCEGRPQVTRRLPDALRSLLATHRRSLDKEFN